MPIYEYQCNGCNHKFELLQKINETPVNECPECHENKIVRLISAAGFQLMGTGWYATDFKDKGKPEAKKSEAAESSKKPADETKKSPEAASDKSKGET